MSQLEVIAGLGTVKGVEVISSGLDACSYLAPARVTTIVLRIGLTEQSSMRTIARPPIYQEWPKQALGLYEGYRSAIAQPWWSDDCCLGVARN